MIPRPSTHAQVERLVGVAASPGISLVSMAGEEIKPLLRARLQKQLSKH